jgi:ADP-ribose pyrophosphatase YjhB (NUDIX family)
VTTDGELYERDPAAWNAYLAKGNAKQARKRVSADAIVRDSSGRILLVDPTYKPDWDLPGGMAEANEPPADAVRRELREELGLGIQVGALLSVSIGSHPTDPGTTSSTSSSTANPQRQRNRRPAARRQRTARVRVLRRRPGQRTPPALRLAQSKRRSRSAGDRPGAVSAGRVRLSNGVPRLYLAYTRLVPDAHLPPHRPCPRPHGSCRDGVGPPNWASDSPVLNQKNPRIRRSAPHYQPFSSCRAITIRWIWFVPS